MPYTMHYDVKQLRALFTDFPNMKDSLGLVGLEWPLNNILSVWNLIVKARSIAGAPTANRDVLIDALRQYPCDASRALGEHGRGPTPLPFFTDLPEGVTETEALLDTLLHTKALPHEQLFKQMASLQLVKVARCSFQLGAVSQFIGWGANVNQKDEEGNTALMEAAVLANITIAKLLIDRGADINLMNNQNETAMAIARGKQRSIPSIYSKPWCSFCTSLQVHIDSKEQPTQSTASRGFVE